MADIFTSVNNEHPDLDSSDLRFRTALFVSKGKVRALFVDRETLMPSSAMSVYETHLHEIGQSKNSVLHTLNAMNYFYTWAYRTADISLDKVLLRGERLKPKYMRAFRAWLADRANTRKNDNEPLDIGYRNAIVTVCSAVFQFFVSQYASFEKDSAKDIAISQIRLDWKNIKTKKRKTKVADDLTEEEIANIEAAMKCEIQIGQGVEPAAAHRNYLMWRLSIEFGMRIGEILLLRLQDLPALDRNNVRIVRVEERGDSYVDPRGTHAPRVKTLSRDLGFVIKNSPIPEQLSIYTTRYRRRMITRHDRKVPQLITEHPFLILEHHRNGAPLSVSSAQDVAVKIAKDSGVERFHWHLSRHSFFNRAYAAIANNPDYKDQKKVLQVFGGWENEQSMDIYVARARKERASMALAFWQQGSNVWEALS